MDYEKKYKEAFERAKNLHEDAIDMGENIRAKQCEIIFPELAESKDDRIRKELIEHIKANCETDFILFQKFSPDDVIAWLEKQGNKYETIWKPTKEQINALTHFVRSVGESGYTSPYDNNTKLLYSLLKDLQVLEKQGKQKPVDKAEPKFHEGEWIVCNGLNTALIVNVDNDKYEVELIDGNKCFPHIDYIDRLFHLWTIADARDGDVLWHSDSASNGIFIFKEIRHDGKVLCYCDYDSEDHFCTGDHHTCCWSNDKYIKPATKEQRDLLFQKMHEAGYEWDAENKQLLSLKAEPTREIKDNDGEISSNWTEEDDANVHCCIAKAERDISNGYVGRNKELIDWLKSLKQRMEGK